MNDTEDLTGNPFYKSLTGKFKKLYNQIVSKKLLVCIPQESSLSGITITKSFVEAHLFQASKYIRGQYHSLGNGAAEFSGRFIITGKGFAARRKVRILFDEPFYTEDFDSFTVYCIERPLIGESLSSASDKDEGVRLKPFSTLEEAISALGFAAPLPARVELDKKTEDFSRAYVIVERYLDHAATKLQAFVTSGVEALLNDKSGRFSACKRNVSDKIMTALRHIYAEDTRLIAAGRAFLAEKNYAAVGIDRTLIPSLRTASQVLTDLPKLATPYERMKLISRVLSTDGGIARAHRGGTVSSDDVLPILIVTLCLSTVSAGDLATTSAFIAKFHFQDMADSKDGFDIATFEAALEFIKVKGRATHVVEREEVFNSTHAPVAKQAQHVAEAPPEKVQSAPPAVAKGPRAAHIDIFELGDVVRPHVRRGFVRAPDVIDLSQSPSQDRAPPLPDALSPNGDFGDSSRYIL